jgi:predicted  nucleic acid-binding Zn-ribbon protein
MPGKSVLNWYDNTVSNMEESMAKRRITLTGQELENLKSQQAVLMNQLQRSNERVEELEKGLGKLKKLVSKKQITKAQPELCESIVSVIDSTVNPPVKARVNEQTSPQAV